MLDLNTSHVKVQHNKEIARLTSIANLNTSHVKVQLNFPYCISSLFLYLNTSHVKVQRKEVLCGMEENV